MPSSFPSASVPVQALRAVVDGSDPTVTLARPFNIIDMVVQPTASNSSGTVKLQRSTDGSSYNDVSDAVAAATSGTVGRAATMVAAQVACSSGNTLRVLRANSAQAICYIYVQPTTISGNA